MASLDSSQDGSSRPTLGKLLSRGQFERPNELLPEGFQFQANHLSAPRAAKQAHNGPRDVKSSSGITLSRNLDTGASASPRYTPSAPIHLPKARGRSPESRSAPTIAHVKDDVVNTEEPTDSQKPQVNTPEATEETKEGGQDAYRLLDGDEFNRPDASRRHQELPGKPPKENISTEPDPQDYYQDHEYGRIAFPPESIADKGQTWQSGSQSPLATIPAPESRESLRRANKGDSGFAFKHVPNVDEPILPASTNPAPDLRPPYLERAGGVADALPDLTFKSPAPGRKRRRGSRILHTETSIGVLSEPGCNELSSRPYSRDSNISKRRTPMSTSRPCPSTPNERLTKGRIGIAQAWNSYFEDENRHTQHLQAENNRLRATIDEHVKNVRVLQHERAALLTANENLEKGLDRSTQKLDETTGKMEGLASKVQEYRKRLNDATDEQQKLYMKSKKMIQDTREELETSIESREAMVQAELEKSESVRRELHKNVAAAVAEAREKISHLDEVNRSLETQLREHQRDLEHEREVAKHLQQELQESHHSNAEVLNTLKYQNSKILTGIEEQHCLYQDSRMTSYELEQKLASITDTLGDVQSKVQNPDEILQQLGSVREDIIERFTEEIRNLSSRTELAEHTEERNHQVEEIKTLCQTIKEQVGNNQEALGWQTSYEEANSKLRAAENQTLHAQARLKETMESSNEVLRSNNELKQQVASLNAQLEELREQLQNAEHTEASEISRLEQLVSEKETSLSGLNVRLEESSEQLRIKEAALEEAELDRQRLTMTLHSVNKRAGTEETEKMRLIASRQDAERRLADSEKARTKVERDLQKAKVRIQHLSAAHSSDELPKLMRENLNRTEDLIRLYISVQQDIDGLKQKSTSSSSSAEVCRLQEACQLLEKDSAAIMDVISGFSKQEEPADKPQDLLPQEPSKRDGELRTTANAMGPAPLSLEEEQRRHRVTLKSPTDELAAPPLTTLQERVRRRTMLPLKSSIKASNRFTAELGSNVSEANRSSAPDPADFRGTQKSLVLSVHSSFNRPVTGNAAPTDRDDDNGPGHSGLKRSQSQSQSQSDGAADDGEQRRKQRKVSPPQSQKKTGPKFLPTRQKLGRSLAAALGGVEGKGDLEADEEDTQEPTMASVSLSHESKGGPLRRQPSGLKTYGSRAA